MTTPLHSGQTVSDGIHIVYAYQYANAGARSAATGFVSADIGKVARQTSDETYWVLTSTAPTWSELTGGGGGAPTYLQSVFAETSVNTTTTSATFVTLLSQSITKQAGSVLKISFTASSSNSANNNTSYFRVQVDGVTVRAFGQRQATANEPQSGAIVLRRTGLAAGARTVTVQWRTTAGTLQIRPVAAPDAEHASLLLEEVTV